MKWVTQAEVKREAKKSLLAALECSRKHHYQVMTATNEELGRRKKVSRYFLLCNFCALCQRFKVKKKIDVSCSMLAINCPLWGGINRSCCNEWRRAWPKWEAGDYSELRIAEKALVEKLDKLIEEEKSLLRKTK